MLSAQEVTLFCSLSPQEVFTEMEEKYGEVEEMNVCDNLGDHLVGNVYVKVGGPLGSPLGGAATAE